jgi:hypothetical protein
MKSQSAATRSNRTSRAPPLSRTRNNSSSGLVVEIGIPKTIYDLNNCTLAPSPSGRALNLTHMFATPKVNVEHVSEHREYQRDTDQRKQ